MTKHGTKAAKCSAAQYTQVVCGICGEKFIQSNHNLAKLQLKYHRKIVHQTDNCEFEVHENPEIRFVGSDRIHQLFDKARGDDKEIK